MTALLSRLSACRISDVGLFWIAYFACVLYGLVAFVDWMVR